jgi:hypothetical protein
MSEPAEILVMIMMYIQGLLLGYIIWAPSTPFKEGVMDGLTFRFLWRKK